MPFECAPWKLPSGLSKKTTCIPSFCPNVFKSFCCGVKFLSATKFLIVTSPLPFFEDRLISVFRLRWLFLSSASSSAFSCASWIKSIKGRGSILFPNISSPRGSPCSSMPFAIPIKKSAIVWADFLFLSMSERISRASGLSPNPSRVTCFRYFSTVCLFFTLSRNAFTAFGIALKSYLWSRFSSPNFFTFAISGAAVFKAFEIFGRSSLSDSAILLKKDSSP